MTRRTAKSGRAVREKDMRCGDEQGMLPREVQKRHHWDIGQSGRGRPRLSTPQPKTGALGGRRGKPWVIETRTVTGHHKMQVGKADGEDTGRTFCDLQDRKTWAEWAKDGGGDIGVKSRSEGVGAAGVGVIKLTEGFQVVLGRGLSTLQSARSSAGPEQHTPRARLLLFGNMSQHASVTGTRLRDRRARTRVRLRNNLEDEVTENWWKSRNALPLPGIKVE
ncbi:hypothetical protein FB451DRAFT_1173230 [Mycena latifolia]|nr:hypothetical protein FB451DRAFT_1173230 [Mycena latifolia]